MSNLLANENSPYLLQHANNPVQWYPWGNEALNKAQREEKPIFLSIGYAACHWCHVMAHESFEDPDTASIMNQRFINIKVDREERPDLDNIYMNAVISMIGHGGWPLSVFLTPEGHPFFGGTYFPPTRRYNMPSFREVLLSVYNAWTEDRAHILDVAQQISSRLAQSTIKSGEYPEVTPETLDNASLALAQTYDWKYGGWGSAPKFPQPMTIEFLLRRASTGDKLALDLATHALRAMAKGGMYDVIGGGFARYSTDNEWRVPHFEKMLYDNALLSQVYLHAYLLTGDKSFRRVCEETLDFIARELSHPSGGFFSSLDADSEGEEGKYYLWTPATIQAAISDKEQLEMVTAAYEITDSGNFEGSTVLQRVIDDASLAVRFAIAEEDVPLRLAEIHKQLLRAREKRVRPATDDKVLVMWNALTLVSFSEAGRYLKRSDYVDMAIRNAKFLLDGLYTQGRLLRSWRNGRSQHNAYLEDYASLVLALISLYQSDPNPYWYTSATSLLDEMIQHFSDPSGGFFDTRIDHEPLITRPKDLQDNATPCGNSLAAMALLQHSNYSGRSDLVDIAETSLRSIIDQSSKYPTAFAYWLCAADYVANPVSEVAIIGSAKDERTQALVNVLWETYRPRTLSAQANLPISTEMPELLDNRELVDGLPAAYVCQNFVCNLPVTTPDELRIQLKRAA